MKSNRKKIIGILGGLGPESTGEFYLKLIRFFAQKFHPKNNKEYPQIIINSIPAPDLIYNINNDNDLKFYINGLKELERWGADVIVIACNGAYAYLELFKKEIRTPIINLPKEVEKFLKSGKKNRVVVFGSKTTVDNKLYEYKSIQNIPLEKKDASEVFKAVSLFNLAREKNKQKKVLAKLYKSIIKKADVILLACSEVALMLNNKPKTLDTFKVLISAALEIYEK